MNRQGQLEKETATQPLSWGEQLADRLRIITEGLQATNCRVTFMHTGPTSRLVFRCERSASAQLYSLLSSQGIVVDQLDRPEAALELEVWRTREGIPLTAAEKIGLDGIIAEIQAKGTKPNNR